MWYDTTISIFFVKPVPYQIRAGAATSACPSVGMTMTQDIRDRPLIPWGGDVVQNEKKIVRRVAEKKIRPRGLRKKRITFGQFNPNFFLMVDPLGTFLRGPTHITQSCAS